MVEKSTETEASAIPEAPDARLTEAHRLVRNLSGWSFGAGCIPLPVVDVVTVMGVQVNMINKLSKLYDVPFSEHTAKNIISTLLGGLVSYGLAWGSVGSAIKGLPLVGNVLGLLTMPGFSAAVTWALGRVYIQHLEAGGTLLTFDPEKMKDHFQAEFDKARAEQGGKGGSDKAAA